MKWAYALIVFFCAVVYFESFCDVGINIWDEGVPLSGALRVERGEIPGKDFIAYAPMRYYLYETALKISSGDISGPRYVMAVLGAIIASLVFWVGFPLLGPIKSLIPVILFLAAPSPYYYRFFTFTLMGSIIILSSGIKDNNSIGKSLAIGIGMAVIIWTREEMGLIVSVLFCVIALWKIIFRPVERFFSCISLIVATVLGWVGKLWLLGGIESALNYYAIGFSSAKGGSSGLKLPWPDIWSANYWKQNSLLFGLQDLMLYIVPFMILWGLIFVYTKHTGSVEYWALWGMSLIGFGLVIWRAGYGNLLRCLPPVSIISVVLLTDESQSSGKLRVWFRKFFRTAVFTFILSDSLIFNPYIYQSIGMAFHSPGKLKLCRSIVHCRRQDVQVIQPIHKILKSALNPGDSLACFPFHPLWNYSTGALNPTYYEFLLPEMVNSKKKVLEAYTEHPPSVILLNNEPFDGIEERRFSRQYPELFHWIRRNYFRWVVVDEFEILPHVPDEAHFLFQGDFENNLSYFIGENRVEKTDFGIVLWEYSGAECRFPCSLPERSALKAGILNEFCGDDYEFDIFFVSTENDMTPIFRGELSRQNLIDGELLCDLSSISGKKGELIFRFKGEAKGRIGIVSPSFFSWPELSFDVDNDELLE